MHGKSGHGKTRLPFAPELGVNWEPMGTSLTSSIRALVYGPVPPRGWPLGPFFRQSWVQTRIPLRTLALSALLHVWVFVMPFPVWLDSPPKPRAEKDRYQLTWYGPVRDLPPLKAPATPGKKSLPSPPGEAAKPLPPKGADAFHPRQLIYTNPPRPNHPRQTLIQPEAPPEAPKILPALPNVVQWNQNPKPARPKLQVNPAMFRGRRTATREVAQIEAPEIQNNERTAGPLNIASSETVNLKPRLPLQPSAVPRAGKREIGNDVTPAPEVGATNGGGENSLRRIIALSANPEPPAPVLDIPLGNLNARLSISPEGTKPGSPGGVENGVAGSNGNHGGGAGSPGGTGGGGGTQSGAGDGSAGGTGPAGVTISGGDPKNTANVSGSGSGIAANRPANPLRLNPLPERPTPRTATPEASVAGSRTIPAFEKYTPGAPPEVVLGPKRIYTLNVNMPNLSSATGSWILQFAELSEEGPRKTPDGTPLLTKPLTDLAGPVPLRKVDPKYPPALASARVQGDVVLYAIIRKDGSVDSIQLVKGIEPTLDQNAMQALSRWKFRAAERYGQAVELEALVVIPFRAVAPY